MMTTLDEILDAVDDYLTARMAIAAPHHESVLEAAKTAIERKLAEPVLVGDQALIEQAAAEAGFDLSGITIVHEPDVPTAARRAAEEVHGGRADILMKGHLHTDDFLRGLLDKEVGLRSGHIMSHVYILETRHLERLTLVTDGAMNIAPDLPTKACIIMNAVYLARLLGIQRPKVCVLAAVELVNPDMPATLEAAALAKMNDRRQFPECEVDGPFALDNAVSALAAQTKKIGGPCAGAGDILLVPGIEAGNILAKSYAFLASGRVAGVLVGATAPVVLTSRADSAESKLYSIATAVYMSDMKRDGQLKIGKVHY